MKEKMDKLDFSKFKNYFFFYVMFKNYFLSKDTIKKVKRRKTFEMYLTDDLYGKYPKNSSKSIRKCR